MIHVATKMARLQNSRALDDHYLDAMNYLAIAAQFAPICSEPVVSMSVPAVLEDDAISKIAKKFSPAKDEQKL